MAVTDPDPWCTVAEFGNVLTAQMARGRLRAEDIEAILLGENFMWGPMPSAAYDCKCTETNAMQRSWYCANSIAAPTPSSKNKAASSSNSDRPTF